MLLVLVLCTSFASNKIKIKCFIKLNLQKIEKFYVPYLAQKRSYLRKICMKFEFYPL